MKIDMLGDSAEYEIAYAPYIVLVLPKQILDSAAVRRAVREFGIVQALQYM